MKAGVVLMVEVAKRILSNTKQPNLTLFFNSDEELASPDSRALSRNLATDAQLVVVFEFTTDESEVKIGSRGNHALAITVRGHGGHAAYPEQLSNPIDGLSEVMSHLRELNQPEIGQVVVPTVIDAGERTNVVPESVTLIVDVRFNDLATPQRVIDKLESITFNDPDLSLSFESLHTIPMHKTNPDSYAFQLAKTCATEFGIDLQGIEARGVSDMNHVGEVNPNVIEALGACGGGAHSAGREYIFVSSLARRAALSTLITERALSDALAAKPQVPASTQQS